MAQIAYEFAGFRFEPFNLRLLYQDRVVPLSAKPCETLLALVQHPDTVITKEALMSAVWPDIAVEENNLSQQISQLRRLLTQDGGPNLIETVPRRGYRFIGRVRAIDVVVPRPVVEETAAVEVDATAAPVSSRPRPQWLYVTSAAVALIAALGFGWRWSEAWRLARASEAARERGEALARANNPRGAAAELQDAIKLDPNNARAYGALAHALANLGSEASSSAFRPAGQSPSVAAALRGVTLDPNCASCHGTLGMFLFYHDWEWDQAEAEYREAIRLGPNEDGIRASRAMLLAAIGRNSEALDEIDSALRGRPYQLSWLVIRSTVLYLGRRYDDAIAAADRALLVSNKDNGAWEWRSKALLQLGRGDDALRALAQAPFAEFSADLDRAVRDGGGDAGLRKLLELTDDWRGRIEHSWRRGPWRAHLQDVDGALDEVERAVEARRLNAIYIGVDPVYDAVREHPRFHKVLETMGLKDRLRATSRDGV